jgi:AraC-like DNA-binding protein
MENLLDQIRDKVLRHADQPSARQALPRLLMAVSPGNGAAEHAMSGLGICLILQGSKQMMIGGEPVRQAAGASFGTIVDVPTTRCHFGTAAGPYVAIGLTPDEDMLMALVADLPDLPVRSAVSGFSAGVSGAEELVAWDRYVALLDAPDDVRALSAPRERELLYRLLQGTHGALLRQMAMQKGGPAPLRRAIHWMQANFDQPVPISALAGMAGMSMPAFNRHFRAVTSTSPRQYQKALQLHAARQMLAKDKDVTRTALAVGYHSASQFSREYSRFFGVPPKRDALGMHDAAK